jgi:hypothetical protein
MKRDMELIRKILLTVEAHEHGSIQDSIKVDGYTEEEVAYHCYLIGDAGLASVIDTTCLSSDGPEADISCLTWEGHEFLDAARDPTTWEAAKTTLQNAGKDLGNVTLAVLQGLLIETTKRSIGL